MGWEGFEGGGEAEEAGDRRGAEARMSRRIRWVWGSGPWRSTSWRGGERGLAGVGGGGRVPSREQRRERLTERISSRFLIQLSSDKVERRNTS